MRQTESRIDKGRRVDHRDIAVAPGTPYSVLCPDRFAP